MPKGKQESIYVHRNDVHDNSMSALMTPVSLVEYAIRREHYGEGMLVVTNEGALTGGATQKYPHVQKQVLANRKKENKTFRQRMDEIDPKKELPQVPLPGSAQALKPPSRYRKDLPKSGKVIGNVGVSRIGMLPHQPDTDLALHGIVGTANPHSPYIFLQGDRSQTVMADTLLDRQAYRITNEQRKVVRAQIAYALRRVKDITGQARIRQYQQVLEAHIIQIMNTNADFKMMWFSKEEWAQEQVTRVVDDILVGNTCLKEKLFKSREAEAVPSIPDIAAATDKKMGLLFKQTRIRNEVEGKMEDEKFELEVPQQIFTGLNLGSGYQRWDYDVAIWGANYVKNNGLSKPPGFHENFERGVSDLHRNLNANLSSKKFKMSEDRINFGRSVP